MKRNYLKVLFWSFSLMFVLFSCETDTIENEISTTQNKRPEKQQNRITTEDAKDIAVRFLNQSKSDDRSEVAKDDIKEVQTIVNDEETPIMYAVNLNKGNGFVVISASFVERPILAYSEKGNFDFETIGDYNGVVDWAYTTYLTINDRLEKKEESNDEVADQWQSFGYQAKIPPGCIYMGNNTFSCPDGDMYYPNPPIKNVSYETIKKGPLLSTEWDQTARSSTYLGYNNFVRYYNCPQGTSPAGCVAVAMGQIMKYHNHPNIYSINTMPNKVNGWNYPEQNAKNVAYLLQNIGYNVNMSYYCDVSYAYSETARNSFIYNYGYDASALVNSNYYLAQQSISNNRPICTDGCRNRIVVSVPIKLGVFKWTIGKTTYEYTDCHAWVVDGYQKIKVTTTYVTDEVKVGYAANQLVHCNWGWGNFIPYNYNGWYYFGTWNDEQNQNVPNVDYIYIQKMIHNVKPKNN